MKKLFVLMFVGIFLFSLVNAEIQTLGTFKQGNSINLIQTCATCTFNNITSVLNPDSTQVIGEFEMTKVGSVYNLTLSSGNATVLGNYIVNGVGDLDGTNTVWNYDFDLTADGKPFRTFPTQFSVIILALVLVAFGLFNERFTLFKHMGGIILMIVGIITLYPGYNFINHTTLFGLALGSGLVAIGFWSWIEDSFSRERQGERFNQPQGEEDFEEEEFEE